MVVDSVGDVVDVVVMVGAPVVVCSVISSVVVIWSFSCTVVVDSVEVVVDLVVVVGTSVVVVGAGGAFVDVVVVAGFRHALTAIPLKAASHNSS